MKKFFLYLLVSLIAFGAAAADLNIYIDTGTSKMYDGKVKDLYQTVGIAVGEFFRRSNIYEGKRPDVKLYVYGVYQIKDKDELKRFSYLQHGFDSGKRPETGIFGEKQERLEEFYLLNPADKETKLSLFDTQFFNDADKNAKDSVFVIITNSGIDRERISGGDKAAPVLQNVDNVKLFRRQSGVKVFVVYLPELWDKVKEVQYRDQCKSLTEQTLQAAWNATIYPAPQASLKLEAGAEPIELVEGGKIERAFYAPLKLSLVTEKASYVSKIVVNGKPLAAGKGRQPLAELTIPDRHNFDIRVVGSNGDEKVYAASFRIFDRLKFYAKANGFDGADDPKAPTEIKGNSPFDITFSTASSNADGEAQWFVDGVKFDDNKRKITVDVKEGVKEVPVWCQVKGYDGKVYRKYFKIAVMPPKPPEPPKEFAWSVKLNGTELVDRRDVVLDGQEKLTVTFEGAASNGKSLRWFRNGKAFQPGATETFTENTELRCEVVDNNNKTRSCTAKIKIAPFTWSVKLNGTELVDRGNVLLSGKEKLAVNFWGAASNGKSLRWFRNGKAFQPGATETFTENTELRCEVVDNNNKTRSCTAKIKIAPFTWSVKLNGRELVDRGNVLLSGKEKLAVNFWGAASNGKSLRWFRDGREFSPGATEIFTENASLRCEVVDGNGNLHSCTAGVEIKKESKPLPLTVKIGGEERRKDKGVITVPSKRGEEAITFAVPTTIQKDELVKYSISYGELTAGAKGGPIKFTVEKYEWEKALPSGKVHQVIWYHNGAEVERFTIDIRRGRYLVIRDQLRREPEKIEGDELPRLEFNEDEGNPVSFALCGVPDDADLGKYFMVVEPTEGEGEHQRIALSEFAKSYKEGFSSENGETENAEKKSAENADPEGNSEQKPDPRFCGVYRGEFHWAYSFPVSDSKVQVVYAGAPGQPDEKLAECRVLVNEVPVPPFPWGRLIFGLIVVAAAAVGVWWYFGNTVVVTLGAEKHRLSVNAKHQLDRKYRDGPEIALDLKKQGGRILISFESFNGMRITQTGDNSEVKEGEEKEIKPGKGLEFGLKKGKQEWTLSIKK